MYLDRKWKCVSFGEVKDQSQLIKGESTELYARDYGERLTLCNSAEPEGWPLPSFTWTLTTVGRNTL